MAIIRSASQTVRQLMLGLVLLAAPMLSAHAQDGEARHIRIVGGGKGKPFVILLPGSGGRLPTHWGGTITGAGFAAVYVDMASIHGGSLLTVSENTQARSISTAVEVAKAAGLDASRYAILGLSKGGTAALIGGGSPAPRAVFALYPGSQGWCPNSHSSSTTVHIFYGTADGWGTHRGTRDACKSRAGGNVQFHEYPGVHHNFDSGGGARQNTCCGGLTYTSQGDARAASHARGIVASTLRNLKR